MSVRFVCCKAMMKMSMVNSQPPMAMHSKRPERQKTSWIDDAFFFVVVNVSKGGVHSRES